MRVSDALQAISIVRTQSENADGATLDRAELELLLHAIHDEEDRMHSTERRLVDLETKAERLEKRMGIEPGERRLLHPWDEPTDIHGGGAA